MNKIYIFDFDGTLTKKDTLFDFLKKTQSNYYLGYLLFIPLFVLAKLKVLEAGKVKEKFIAFFLKGKTKQEIQKLANLYFQNSKDLFHEKAKLYLEDIKNHQEKYLVSASLDIWLEPFANYFNLKLICTKAKFLNDDTYSGKYDGSNCNHQEKVKRIKETIPLENFDEIYIFGDTKGDLPMLKLATKPHFKYFES